MSGLYVHLPYCHSKCAYCDFYSLPRCDTMERYVAALPCELRVRMAEMPASERFRTVYVGGGTPSMVPLRLLSKLVAELRREADLSAVEEFTIEANPEDVTPEWIEAVKRLGINRVSMGVQSLEDTELKMIGRTHDAATALRALELLASSGVNFNADMIYGLPGQTLESWRATVSRIIDLRPNHLSAYSLMLEPGTRLYAMLLAGKISEAPEELTAVMYDALCAAAAAAGYEHYEISNFARPGFHSRHNSAYWDDTPYLGLGVSACSFDGLKRRRTPINIPDYLRMVAAGESPSVVEEETEADRLNDYILTSLRTAGGLSLRHVEERYGTEYKNRVNENLQMELRSGRVVSADQLDSGCVPYPADLAGNACRPDRYRIPEKFSLVSDAIIRNVLV